MSEPFWTEDAEGFQHASNGEVEVVQMESYLARTNILDACSKWFTEVFDMVPGQFEWSHQEAVDEYTNKVISAQEAETLATQSIALSYVMEMLHYGDWDKLQEAFAMKGEKTIREVPFH